MKPTRHPATSNALARAKAAATTWDDLALQRTWRSFGTVGILLGLVNTAWAPIPGMAVAAVGAWAYAKGCPQCQTALAVLRRR